MQAQFLIPMATSIAFGLGFATVLVLLVIPALMSFYESLRARLAALLARSGVSELVVGERREGSGLRTED
jgi:hypothetical protein